MSNLMISVQVARTRLYRVILWAASAAGAGLLLLDRFGPGIGLTPWDIGVIGSVLTFIVTTGRQIQDPSTPALPTPGPVVLPPEGTIGKEAP